MPQLRISQFGQAGLNADTQPTLLNPGEWTTLDNIDIEDGSVRSAWGESLVTSAPPIEPTYIFVFEGDAGTWLIISDGTMVYAWNKITWENITPTDAPVDKSTWETMATDFPPGTWDFSGSDSWDDTATGGTPIAFAGDITFSVFLGILIVTASESVPTYWPDSSGRLQILPGWNVSWRAQTVVAYANHLVAIGFNDGATGGAKYRVAWSDAAAEGEIPQGWDFADVTKLAGSVQLRDTEGYLVTAEVLRDDLVIYKQDSIYRMFLRGDEFVMGFERVVSDHGCDSFRGVTNIGDAHFFADRGDLRIFNGQNTQSIATGRVRRSLSRAIDNISRDKTIVAGYPEKSKIYVGVVPAGSSTIDFVLVFDLEHNAWTLKRYTGAVDMTLGPFAATVSVRGRTWDEATGSWDQQTGSWDQSVIVPTEDGILISDSADNIYRIDESNDDFAGNAKRCIAERVGFVFAELDRNVTIREVLPEFESRSNAEVEIFVGIRNQVGGPTTWSRGRPFRIGTDRHVNFRITGQPTAFRVTSRTTGDWRLGALTLGYVEAGGRR